MIRPAHRSSNLPLSWAARCAMTIRIHYRPSIEIRFSTIPNDTDQGFGHPPQREEPRATCDETRETAARDIYVEYVRDSNYGLCPAVMATTVRRFPLGMTIDDRGLRERLLSLFFFSILYFLRCRHRFGGNENLIGGVFVHSDRPATTSTSRVRER